MRKSSDNNGAGEAFVVTIVLHFQGTNHPNIYRYETSEVGWLSLAHCLRVVERIGFLYPIYSPFYTLIWSIG